MKNPINTPKLQFTIERLHKADIIYYLKGCSYEKTRSFQGRLAKKYTTGTKLQRGLSFAEMCEMKEDGLEERKRLENHSESFGLDNRHVGSGR